MLDSTLSQLEPSAGPMRLETASLFGSASVIKQQGSLYARVDRLRGWCNVGWRVEAGGRALSETDLLLVGLAYGVSRPRGGGPM